MTAPEEPVAATAGEEDHDNPWQLAGEDADPPIDDDLEEQ